MRTSVITMLLFLATSLYANDSTHVAILGDSNTWLGGDQCDQPRGWNKWFKDYFAPASCRSYARSGATLTNTADIAVPATHTRGAVNFAYIQLPICVTTALATSRFAHFIASFSVISGFIAI